MILNFIVLYCSILYYIIHILYHIRHILYFIYVIIYIMLYILLYIYYTIEEWEIPSNCIFYSTTQLSSTFIWYIHIYIWIYIYIHIMLHVTCLPKLSTSFQVHLGQRCGRVARPIFLPRISVGLVGREKPWVTQVMNSSLFT